MIRNTSRQSESEEMPHSEGVTNSDPLIRMSQQGSRKLPRLRLFLILILLMFSMWRMVVDRDYWLSAWRSDEGVPRQTVSNLDLAPVNNQLSGVNSFDLSRPIIPVSQIRSGGPPKDGIPALTNPKLVAVAEAKHLKPEDRVIGVVTGKVSRAYPLKILTYHEVVNDRIDDGLIAVTYCPLCDSAAVFDRHTALGVRDFGVSGLLYNSNVLLYDRRGKPEGLWSQLKSSGVTGPGSGKTLETWPLELTTWKNWKQRYPDTKVMSAETGHQRDYNRNPYAAYFASPELMFPVHPESNQLPAKARVLGVWTQKTSRAYPASAFGEKGNRVEESMDGKRVVIEFDTDDSTLRVSEADEGVHWMYSFWFAWYAFRPDSTIYQPMDVSQKAQE